MAVAPAASVASTIKVKVPVAVGVPEMTPAVLSVSQDTFIMVTSNIFAILGLRSLYFVLAGMMAKFRYLKLALAVLLVGIGAKMIAHDYYEMPHLLSLAIIAGIIAIGILASVIANARSPASPSP